MHERRNTRATSVTTLAIVSLVLATRGAVAEPDRKVDETIAEMRYQVTAIEHGDEDKIVAYGRVIATADALIRQAPRRAEPLIWKGIALAAMAKHKGVSALADVREARRVLKASLKIDPAACGGAALNALGILYHKVPVWPLAFGNDKTARNYFEQALATSSNLDTNYRFGEFLIDEGENKRALTHLETALAFPDRPGRREETLKKQEIRALIDRLTGR